MQLITEEDRFVPWFSAKIAGTRREITPKDVQNTTEWELINSYGYQQKYLLGHN